MPRINTQAEYDAAVRHGWHPLVQPMFQMEHGLRVFIQKRYFGSGHTPEENERFYKWVWEHKPHYCENCMKPLPNYSAVHISHILTRGAHPAIVHDPRNTNILCAKCHAEWENGNRQDMRIYESAMMTADDLIKEYYIAQKGNE